MLPKIKQKQDSPILQYSPPSHNSFGKNPIQRDPFESNSVEVKESTLGFGEGLFTSRYIRKGDFICFYSGYFIKGGAFNQFERRNVSKKKIIKTEM